MKNINKKTIEKEITNINLTDFEYDPLVLDDFIRSLTDIKNDQILYNKEDKLFIRFSKNTEYYEDDEEYIYYTLDISVVTLETDKEYENRIKAKERSKQKRQQQIEKKRLEQEANDKKEYLRLKRMFGGKL
jgi:hypothetical protein